MTLEELGRQYAAEADSLEEMIASCGVRRRIAIRAGDSEEAFRQKNLAQLHAEQQNDLLRLSDWLRHYYDAPYGEESRDVPTLATRGWVHAT